MQGLNKTDFQASTVFYFKMSVISPLSKCQLLTMPRSSTSRLHPVHVVTKWYSAWHVLLSTEPNVL